MKRTACLILVLLANLPGQALPEEPVYFADSNLKAAVEETLGISDPTPTDMLTLFYLDASTRGIVDLTGLEHATSLLELGLANNEINDITSLSGLTSILWLDLSYNQIRDISELSELTNIVFLFLNDNQISDISALSEFYFLLLLDLRHNPLNEDAHEIYIPLIYDNNLGLHPFWWPIDYDPPFISTYELTIESTDGGSVTIPGEGTFYYYDQESMVAVKATLEPNHHFVNWTGTAVDAGKVAGSNFAVTTVIVDGNYTLQANFAPGNNPPASPTLLLPANEDITLTITTFQLFAIDADNDRLKYKIEVLQNNVIVRTFDQTQDATDWDEVEYNNLDVATFTIPESQALENGSYQWRAYAFDGMQWSTASQTWSFIATIELEQIETDHFFIKYTTNPVVSWHSDDETYVTRVAQYMEDAYEFFVEHNSLNLGWSTDSVKYKVYIGGSFIYIWGIWGELRSDGYAIRGDPLGTYVTLAHNLQPVDLRLTCFHEYFHAIQHAYHRFFSFGRRRYQYAKLWIIEGNAKAIEYIAPGYPNDFTDGIGDISNPIPVSFNYYLRDTQRSLMNESEDKDPYRPSLYWYFLMRNTKIEFDGNSQRDVDNNIENISVIRTLWEKLHEFGTYDSWDYEVVKKALDAALVNADPSQYGNFDASFIAFAKANLIAITKPSNSEEQFYQPSAALSIQTYGRNSTTLEPVELRSPQNPIARNVENYGVRYFKITNANQGDQIQISFNGDEKSTFFVKIYPAGDIGREDTINNWDIVTLPENDVINTVVVVGRLDDSGGSGDFTVTFSYVP